MTHTEYDAPLPADLAHPRRARDWSLLGIVAGAVLFSGNVGLIVWAALLP